MVDRGSLFGETGFRWIPAKSKVSIEYCLFIAEAGGAPQAVERTGSTVVAPGLFELPIG